MSARGNRGPGLTGSNGNAGKPFHFLLDSTVFACVIVKAVAIVKPLIAGPVNAAGQAYDPAAETYKKQVTHLL